MQTGFLYSETMNGMQAAGLKSELNVLLSPSQILNLFSTPVPIYPAPGPDKVFIPTSMVLNYQFGGTPYSSTGGTLQFQLGGSPIFFAPSMNGFWDQASSQYIAIVNGGTFVRAASAYTNQPVSLQATVANPTGGNGSIAVTIKYYIFPGQA